MSREWGYDDTEGWLGETCRHAALPLPARVGPAEFGELGRLVAVRAPRELDDIFRRAGGTWQPGSRRWLIERRRIGPVIRALRRTTDPLSGERAYRWTNRALNNRAPAIVRHAARRMRRRASSSSCIT